MGSVDDRVVEMKFDNGEFERRVASTITSLGKLQERLDFTAQNRGLQDLSKASKTFSLDGIRTAVDNIASRFNSMGAIGFSVINNLTNTALDFAKKTSHALIDPLIQGGKERALQIEQAQFQFRGLGINVDQAMQSALDAVRGTAFGLGDAASAAAQLSASGIKVGSDMTSVLRAIAGSAAMTSSSFSDISQIFTQSAASGKINSMDLQQFATRGLNAAAAVAKQMGKTEVQVRAMASNGTLDFKTFATAMDKAFGAHATQANETYKGSLANLHAALSRLGAAFFSVNLTQQRDLFNSLSPVIDKLTTAVKPFIDMILRMTGLDIAGIIGRLNGITFKNLSASMPGFISAFSDIFKSIHDVVKAITSAFHDVFPPSAQSSLVTFSKVFAFLVHVMTPTPQILNDIRSIFRGVFSVVSIGITIIKDISLGFLELFKLGKDAGGISIFDFFAKLGDKMFELKKTLVDGGGITEFFKNFITSIVTFMAPIQDAISKFDFSGTIKNVIEGFDKLKESVLKVFNVDSIPGIKAISSASDELSTRWTNLTNVGQKLGDFFTWLSGKLTISSASFGDWLGKLGEAIKDNKITDFAKNAIDKIGQAFGKLPEVLAGSIRNQDNSKVFDAINVGVLSGIVILVTKFFKNAFKTINIGEDLVKKVSKMFDNLNGVLQGMQQKLKAEVLLKIAEAIGALTASLVILSLINAASLTKALTAVGVGFGELVGAMAILDKIVSGPKQAASLDLVIGGIIALSGALLVLSGVVAILGNIKADSLTQGLSAIGLLITEVIVAMKTMKDIGIENIAVAVVGMNGMATAVTILGVAVKILSTIDPKALTASLAGIGILLTEVVVAMKNMPSHGLLIKTGDGIIAISIAIVILAEAVKLFATMSPDQMIQGLIGVGLALTAVTVAVKNMPVDMPGMGAGLILVATGLIIMSKAVEAFGNMDMGTMVKGLGGIAAALTILAVATDAMTGTLLGSAAIVVAAAALIILADGVKAFNDIGIGSILTGLLGLAIAITVIAVGSVLLSEAVPFILALGAALLVLGAGLALIGLSAILFGAGLLLIAEGIKILVSVGTDGINQFIDVLPNLTVGVVKAILAAIKTLFDGTPELLDAFGKILGKIFELIIKFAPQAGEAFGAIVQAIAKFIVDHSGEMIVAGFILLVNFLKGLYDNIGQITVLVSQIIIRFLDKLNDNLPQIIDAGARLLITFLDGIARNIQGVINAGANLIVQFVRGLAKNVGPVIDAGADLIVQFLDGLGRNTQKIIDAGFKLLIDFLNGLANSINKNQQQLHDAGWNVALAIINGMTGGLVDLAEGVYNKAIEIANNVVDKVKGVFGINSPSKVFSDIAKSVAEGFVVGLSADTSATQSAEIFGNDVVSKINETMSRVSAVVSTMDEFNPTITPVLDLTDIQKDASQINSLIGSSTIDTSVSFNQAASLAVATKNQGITNPDGSVSSAFSGIQFNQTINAPKELSTSEIYRQTKSQISMAKEELKL